MSPTAFDDDPLRLLRAARFVDQFGFALDDETAALVRERAELVGRPAGERILAELRQLSADGLRLLDDLGLLEPLGGSLDRLAARDSPAILLARVFGRQLERYPLSNDERRRLRALLRARRPADDSPRELYRFRRETEPWALEALEFVGAPELSAAVEQARQRDPTEPLLRGDELGVPPGPEVGRLLERVAEERAAGTIVTREDALALVERERTPDPPTASP